MTVKKDLMLGGAALLAIALLGGCRTRTKAPSVVSPRYGQTSVLTPIGSKPVEDIVEVLKLDGIADSKRWDPAECEVSQSNMLAETSPAVHMHIPVDFNAGEEKYPIGWPRMYTNLTPKDGVWADYDRFEFTIYTEMSRKELPRNALSFTFYTKDGKNTTITMGREKNMKLGEWVKVVKPISDITSVDQFYRIGINISESNYNDGDVLDFHMGHFRLVRATHCTVKEMTAQPAYLYEDAKVLPLRLVVTGPGNDVARGVPFEVKRDVKVIRRETLPVQRGSFLLNMDVSEMKLTPGEYKVTAFPDNEERRISVDIRVLESPWRKQEKK